VAVEFVFALDARPDCRPYEPEVVPAPIPLPSARALAAKTRNPVFDAADEAWLDRLGTRPLQELCAILKRARQPRLMETVAVVLGASGRDEAVDTLSLALRFSRAPETRLAAACALAEIGSDKAVAALIAALEAEASAVADDALSGLRLLSGQDFGRRPLPWRVWMKSRK
jgi:HEAT repeat protein